MVLQLDNGDILELFRRYRGSRYWDQGQAHRFLSSFCQSAGSVAALRSLVPSERTIPNARAGTVGDLLPRAARLIANETLVLTHHRQGDRLPATGVVLHSAAESILALPGFGGGSALHLLRALAWANDRTNPSASHPEIDSLLGGSSPGTLSDLLRSGDVIALWHSKDHYSGDTVAPAEPYHAPRSQAAPEPEEVQDAATFSPNIDAARIAAVKREAALLGIPFCEECVKAALARGNA